MLCTDAGQHRDAVAVRVDGVGGVQRIVGARVCGRRAAGAPARTAAKLKMPGGKLPPTPGAFTMPLTRMTTGSLIVHHRSTWSPNFQPA